MRYVTDALVPIFNSVSTGADKKRSARSRTVDLPGFLVALPPRRKSFRALKFAPKEAYIGNLTDGRPYMNAASCYHDLPGEQGDSLEASLAYGTGIYASWLLPFSACSRCERATSLTAHDIPCTATSFTVPPIQTRPPRHSRASRATLLSKRLNTHHYTH